MAKHNKKSRISKWFSALPKWRKLTLCIVSALLTAAIIQYGLKSPIVAVCAVLAVIVIIDATGVRYETGKQSKMLNKIVQELFTDTENAEVHFKEFIGHTPFQVLIGALLGVAVGIGMSFAFGQSIFT